MRPLCLLLCAALFGSPAALADIYEWEYVDPADPSQGKQESTTLVPHGLGVQATANANLSSLNLQRGYFINYELQGANFFRSNLIEADLSGADLRSTNIGHAYLRGANLSGADLSGASLESAELHNANLGSTDLRGANLSYADFAGADLAGARIEGANFKANYGDGVTAAQITSTASFQSFNLQNVNLSYSDLTGMDLDNQNLAGAVFEHADLAGGSVRNANLSGADLSLTQLTGVDFDGATIQGATFKGNNVWYLTKEQLYATASYQAKDLNGVTLSYTDISGWDLSEQNLDGSNFLSSTFTDANFTGASMRGAQFSSADSRGFTSSQLYSTASYQSLTLGPIRLSTMNLSGWDFSSQDLAGANFYGSNLGNVDLSDAQVAGATFGGDVPWLNLTYDMLATTRSFQEFDLAGLQISSIDLSGWDLEDQYLADAILTSKAVQLAETNFSRADIRGVAFRQCGCGSVLGDAITTNLIHGDGSIQGFNLAAGDRMFVRDYHGEDAPIAIRVEDKFTSNASSTLHFLLEAASWESTISFAPAIPVSLGGSLRLDFAAGVSGSDQLGRTFALFDWAGVAPTGAFDIITGAGQVWDLSRLYTTGEVTLVSLDGQTLTLAGDFNLDGRVDAADYTVWRDNVGRPVGTLLNDTSTEGLIGDDQYALWAANYGSVLSASQATPEPAAALLLLAAVGGVPRRRPR